MEDSVIFVNTVLDTKTVKVPITPTTTAEDACIYVCKHFCIGPIARHLFSLREHGSKNFVALNAVFTEKNSKYDFRIRYKVANISNLKKHDVKAYDYYFHQARNDVLENKIPDIVYEKYKRELVGLGVADMYRVILEKDIPREIVESDYKKYIPKEVLKRHSFFIKKPIHDSLGKIKKSGHDAWYVKAEYLKQLEAMAPEYLSEEYRAVTDMDGSVCSVYVRVSPFHPSEPGVRVCYDSKREIWQQLCTIGDLCFVSVRNDGTVEISRKNGIPSYLKFNSLPVMQSFVSLLDGYYRLMVKWIFNLCKDIVTPSLHRLYAMKCHGPVGGEFSYAKLEEKRNNRPGCFILRESESKYNTFYIDVCVKNSLKPKSYKLEKIGPDEFIFNDDLRRYKSVQQLMAAYNDASSAIYLQECLPPSEYDKSPLLLCQPDIISGDSLTDSISAACLLPATPVCINTKDLQVYKGKKTALSYWNYCRDPYGEKNGTYCYILDRTADGKRQYTKQYCHIRLCKATECRMAGTGNDYIGTLSTTRSNRTCQNWMTNVPHTIPEIYRNSSLYADENVTDAKNYCRDPSRNIAGPWCYTTDKQIPMDLCNVRDCARPEECIVMTRSNGRGRLVYILPEWKEHGLYGGLHFALKEWNPDLLDGIIFEFMPLNDDGGGGGYMQLTIGAQQNERVLLRYGASQSTAQLVKEKTLPHLIPAGRWAPFRLQIRRGEVVLSHEGSSESLFEWRHDNQSVAFEPGFLTYMSIQDHIIGVYFQCTACHTERTSTTIFSRIMPISLWKEETAVANNLTLYLRGTGVALVPLLLLPSQLNYYGLAIGDLGTYIIFLLNTKHKAISLKSVNMSEPALQEHHWTKYQVLFNETSIHVLKNDQSVLLYEHNETLLFYWFSIGAEKGWITWTANCEPLDIDGAPVDGGWSAWGPWQCTVSCGGGTGVRYRSCTNPRPNIYGKLCQGSAESTGRCNEFDCGDISPETRRQIRQYLRHHAHSVVLNEDDSFIIENSNLLPVINKVSPKAKTKWTMNGLPLNTTRTNVVTNGIRIKSAKILDAGVYVCMVYRINGQKLVIQVTTIAVKSKNYDVITRTTQTLTLHSNALILGHVYTDLAQKWTLNDTVYIDHGVVTLAAVTVHRLSAINQSHTGVWRCIVEQRDLKLQWTTNIVKVWVKSAPNIYTHLMEDELTSVFFGRLPNETAMKIVVYFIVILTALLVCLGQKKESKDGLTIVYRSMWKVTKGKKLEVAMKVLKHDYCDQYLKEFMELADQWAFLQSNAIVRLYGVTLRSPVTMVMDYVRLGPMDEYLRHNRSLLKSVDLVEAASYLASALWHLEENGIVHGHIRCRKLLVANHDDKSFTIKLSDPGIHMPYEDKDVHWIPVEYYSKLEFARQSLTTDVWAFATTLWEIFAYGEELPVGNQIDTMRYYANGKRLSQPPGCPNDIYQVMRECWDTDPHRRKRPQVIMRDINQILYQVFNSRRTHAYAKVFTKSLMECGSEGSTVNQSTTSLFSNATDETFLGYKDELLPVLQMSEVDSDLFVSSQYGGAAGANGNQQDLGNNEDADSCDLSAILFNFSTAATSLDSINLMQSIFELDDDYNVVLQGRIGQGFYGEVYRGTLEYVGDKDIEPRQVAVKKLKSSAMASGLQDFEREIAIMKTLKHPNIVEILGVYQDPEISLVMEYVQHGSLQSYLKIYRESLTTKQLLTYALDIAKGMDYLGHKHIVHRDLAARNILVVDEFRVKISDFGLAQVMGTNEYYILKTNRDLPIKWYAPESLRDGKFSPRSDVWSYGVTMYEMFSMGEEPMLTLVGPERTDGQEHQNLLDALESGARFPCPVTCPQAIYVRILYPCWDADPHKRPPFLQLCTEIQDLLTQY